MNIRIRFKSVVMITYETENKNTKKKKERNWK